MNYGLILESNESNQFCLGVSKHFVKMNYFRVRQGVETAELFDQLHVYVQTLIL